MKKEKIWNGGMLTREEKFFGGFESHRKKKI